MYILSYVIDGDFSQYYLVLSWISSWDNPGANVLIPTIHDACTSGFERMLSSLIPDCHIWIFWPLNADDLRLSYISLIYIDVMLYEIWINIFISSILLSVVLRWNYYAIRNKFCWMAFLQLRSHYSHLASFSHSYYSSSCKWSVTEDWFLQVLSPVGYLLFCLM